MTDSDSAAAPHGGGRPGEPSGGVPPSRNSEEQPRIVIRDKRRIDPETGQVRDVPQDSSLDEGQAAPTEEQLADIDRLTSELAERTSDLQRVNAEYANYRRRVDRDRQLLGEIAQDKVMLDLVPVLDDIDRADSHGDLTGGFKTVAESLVAALAKSGLESFGDPGDEFDPSMHEAVAHSTSPEVTGPTCVAIMRRGFRRGERILRPAMVAVADPE